MINIINTVWLLLVEYILYYMEEILCLFNTENVLTDSKKTGNPNKLPN